MTILCLTYREYSAKGAKGNCRKMYQVHSCGDFQHLLKNINSLKYLRGINAGQMTLRDLVDGGLDKQIVVICLSGFDDIDVIFKLIKEHSLRVDLTIKSIPFDEKKVKYPESWSKHDWNLLNKRNSQLIEKCRDLVSEK